MFESHDIYRWPAEYYLVPRPKHMVEQVNNYIASNSTVNFYEIMREVCDEIKKAASEGRATLKLNIYKNHFENVKKYLYWHNDEIYFYKIELLKERNIEKEDEVTVNISWHKAVK